MGNVSIRRVYTKMIISPQIKKSEFIVVSICIILIANLIGAFFKIEHGPIARWTHLLTTMLLIVTHKHIKTVKHNSTQIKVLKASKFLIALGVLFVGIKFTSYTRYNYYTLGYSITAVWPYVALPIFTLLLLRVQSYTAMARMQEAIAKIAFVMFSVAMVKAFIDNDLIGLRIHSAFYACMTMIALGYYLSKLYQKNNYYEQIKIFVAIILLLLFPVLGALRSASILTALIIAIRFINKRQMVINITILSLIIAFAFFVIPELEQTRLLVGGNQTLYTPSEMLQSYSVSDPNASIRFEFWGEALSAFFKSPIWGTHLDFEFDFFDRTGNAGVLHNYYVGMLADGGLLLLFPTLIILLTPILHNIARKNRVRNFYLYGTWLLATTGTIFTNCNGHGPLESTVIFIYMAFAVIGLSRQR